MKELVTIQQINFSNEVKRTVNARDLHEFLGVQSKFADWIKNRLVDFIDNQDFLAISKNLENGGRTLEYYLTLETAKHIAMIERNDKGKEIRNYFIAVEEEFKEKIQTPKLPTTIELAQMVIKAEEEKQILQLEIEQKQEVIQKQKDYIKKAEPKLELYDRLQNADGLLSLSNTAIALHLCPKKFIERIEAIGYFKSRDNKSKPLIAKSYYIEIGYFEVKSYAIGVDEKAKIRQQTLVKAKGLGHFREMINTIFADIINKADKRKYADLLVVNG